MDRVRTRAQMQAEFPDNTTREIPAQASRDLVVSAFGFIVAGAPGPLDDNANTHGLGAWFDSGSRWVDLTNARHWFCLQGSPGAASWQAMMFDGQEANGRLDGVYPNPILKDSGVISGTYGDATHVPRITIDDDGTISDATQVAISGGGGPTFDPTSLADCCLWLRDDIGLYQDTAGTIPAVDGSDVQLWKDQSGNANDMPYLSGYTPWTYHTAVYGAAGAVRGAGNSAFHGPVPQLLNTPQFTVFVVAKVDPLSAQSVHILDCLSSDVFMWFFTPSRVVRTEIGSSPNIGDFTETAWTDDVHVFCRRWAGNLGPSDAGPIRGWFDGVQESVTLSGTPPATVNGGGDLYVGGIPGGFFMYGDLLEIIFYSRTLNPAEVQAVNVYLGNKYRGANEITDLLALVVNPSNLLTGPLFAPYLDLSGLSACECGSESALSTDDWVTVADVGTDGCGMLGIVTIVGLTEQVSFRVSFYMRHDPLAGGPIVDLVDIAGDAGQNFSLEEIAAGSLGPSPYGTVMRFTVEAKRGPAAMDYGEWRVEWMVTRC